MQLFCGEGRAAGEQLVEDHTERINVGPCVDVEVVEFRLLGGHVLQRADDLPDFCVHRPLGQLLAGRLGHAEVDDLRHRFAVVERDQHVRRFEVAVDYSFLVGVLHGLADGDEEFEPFARGEVLLVTIFRDRDAFDQLHREVGAALRRGAGVQHLGDVLMVHQRQRLPLGLEPAQNLRRVHPGFDELERDAAFYRFGLFSRPDRAHAPFAKLLQELVRTDPRADWLERRLGCRRGWDYRRLDLVAIPVRDRGFGWMLEEASGLLVRLQQCVNLPAQLDVAAASVVEMGLPRFWHFDLQRGEEDLVDAGIPGGHGFAPADYFSQSNARIRSGLHRKNCQSPKNQSRRSCW